MSPEDKCPNTVSTNEIYSATSQRISLRSIDNLDVEDIYILLGEERVSTTWRRLPTPWNIQAAEKWANQRFYRGRPGFFCTIRNERSEFIGLIGLSGMSNSLTYALCSNSEGNGYASEAVITFCKSIFKDFDLEKITASCLLGNDKSISLLKKVGFEDAGFVEYKRNPLAEKETLKVFEIYNNLVK